MRLRSKRSLVINAINILDISTDRPKMLLINTFGKTFQNTCVATSH